MILSLCAGAQSKAKISAKKSTRLNEIVGNWKLISIQTYTHIIDIAFQNSNKLSITFTGDRTYKCFLSENTCYGTYNLKNGFFINAGGCTKICCDDEISKKFYDYLIHADGSMIDNKHHLVILSQEHILTFERQ